MLRTALLLSLIVCPALAQTSPMLEAIRSRDWSTARTLAGTPLGLKLVDFLRLLTPHQANAAEILAFLLHDNPVWPDRPQLEQRYGDALITEGDEPDVARLCAAHMPEAANAVLRCAEAFALSATPGQADSAAREAWRDGIMQADEEAAFLARWGHVVTSADQVARFNHIIGNEAAAQRQVARLPVDQRQLAAARLAFRHQDPAALSLLDAVPATLRNDPPLLLDQAKYLRRTHQEASAVALWRSQLGAVEATVPQSQRGPFWAERDALARTLMGQGNATDAFAVARDGGLPAEQAQESDFLAGYIALDGLHDPDRARPHFRALKAASHAAISLARGAYWLGRATLDANDSHAAFAEGAQWPLTYYGQKSALAAGETPAALRARIASLRDPALPPGDAARVQGTDIFLAAQLLAGWQDTRRAADFFVFMLQPPATQAARQVVAEAALADNLPDVAVMAARLIGKDGGALPVSGWPIPVQPPSGAVPAPLLLAIMRQESGFDAKIVSGAGAHGLMQLMPATAGELARANHIAAGPLSDPAVNMRLGSVYLAGLLTRFGDVVPFAVAAYDAGPHRVQTWLNNARPDANDDHAMIDWIEAIPYAETRNYVERVLENRTVYEARDGG